MRKLSLALLLLAACGGDDDPNACVFDGRYELGFVPTNGCEGGSFTLPGTNLDEECSVTVRDVNLEGTPYVATISCPAGDPVIECEGFATYANGCEYDVYLRRLSP
jgi:hypothetical protein